MSQIVEIKVPDIGSYSDVDVIEVAVKVGDTVAVDDTLITLETDKATMDVPADKAGVVKEVLVKVGDKVSEGSAIVKVEETSAAAPAPAAVKPEVTQAAAPAAVSTAADKQANEIKAQVAAIPNSANNDLRAEIKSHVPQAFGSSVIDEASFQKAHASPSVRKLARELGVDLGRVSGNGPKGRITPDDLRNFVKAAMQQLEKGGTGSLGAGLDLLPWPQVDFSKFGEIEVKELSRIKKISGKNLARNWVMIPHVTFQEDADMTELEAFRKQLNKEWERAGIKVSPLAFVILACVKALQEFPEFNSSLDGENLILKKYINIGFAADTPNGLVVPVIKNADQKGLKEISIELAEMSKRAREGKLKPQEMQGASFTISSLGGIGGSGFTPIVNAPEVAILGVCKSQIKPSWNGKEFEPRLMCPLSLSLDHRVIDGAAGMRFLVFISKLLADFRRVSL